MLCILTTFFREDFVEPSNVSTIFIHNPIKAEIVTLPYDYYLFSTRNFARLEYELEVIALNLF